MVSLGRASGVLKLFEGVFGASDETLGAIESSVDIEHRILNIYQDCRNDKQIEIEFNRLQEQLKDEIEARTRETRFFKIIEHTHSGQLRFLGSM